MGLAIPRQIHSIEEDKLRNERVSFGGMVKEVCWAFALQFVLYSFFPKAVEF